MTTDIEYLTLLERDLKQAAARETLLDATPPGRRRPHLSWGTFAAAAVPILVVAGLIGWLVTGGAGGSSGDVSSVEAGGEKAVFTTAPQIQGSTGAAGNDQAVGVSFPAFGPAHDALTGGPGFPQPGSDVSKIIRDGTISIQVAKDGFSDGFAAVTRIAQNNGGFVLSSQIRGQRAGTLTLRIPAKRFDDAMLALRDIGTVQAQSITGKDVTAQFIDLQARLRIAESRRAVLLGLQGNATTIAEVLTVQRQLDNVQLQIEQIQGQLNFINDQVAEATIRVDVQEKDAPIAQSSMEVKNPSLASAWDRSVQGFLNVVSIVVIGLGYLIPIGILALGLWLVALAARRRRAAS